MIRQLSHTFFSFFNAGGPLMWPIFFVSLAAWMLGIVKLRVLNRFSTFRRRYLANIKAVLSGHDMPRPTGFLPYDELINDIRLYVNGSPGACSPQCRFREFLVCSVPEIERGFSSMSAWITVAPLLGLLGTVAGMVQTFKVITEFGLGNPGLTAEGISVALLTTQAGLTVSFPMMLFQNYLLNRSRNLKAKLALDGENLVKHAQSVREILRQRHSAEAGHV